jgi:hypothetical protein
MAVVDVLKLKPTLISVFPNFQQTGYMVKIILRLSDFLSRFSLKLAGSMSKRFFFFGYSGRGSSEADKLMESLLLLALSSLWYYKTVGHWYKKKTCEGAKLGFNFGLGK